MKLTPTGKKLMWTTLGAMVATTVIVVAAALDAGRRLQGQESTRDKSAKWEYVDGVDGSNLQRLETPLGWIVEGEDDNYMIFVPDPEKKWLK